MAGVSTGTATSQILRSKLILVGEGRAGKTATSKSLLGQPFDPHEKSTIGCTSTEARLDTKTAANWTSVSVEDELDRVLSAALMADGNSDSVPVEQLIPGRGSPSMADGDSVDKGFGSGAISRSPSKDRLSQLAPPSLSQSTPPPPPPPPLSTQINQQSDQSEHLNQQQQLLLLRPPRLQSPHLRPLSQRWDSQDSLNNDSDQDSARDGEEHFGLKQLLDKVKLTLSGDIQSLKSKKNHILYTVWDFAGQSVFYDLLHILMTRYDDLLKCLK